MDVAVVGSQGRYIYFEVVCATGSLFCRAALWDCYGGKILNQFPKQPWYSHQRNDIVIKTVL